MVKIMENRSTLTQLGFSQYEASCYMALVGSHPVNGSQLSKISGIARSRIYDVLRSLIAKGYVIEVQAGQYAPLPSDEVIRRLKREFETNIDRVEKEISKATQKEDFEYVWTLTVRQRMSRPGNEGQGWLAGGDDLDCSGKRGGVLGGGVGRPHRQNRRPLL